MIVAAAGDHLFVGLSATNLELLRNGQPMKFDLKNIGSEGTIIIFFGETEAKMREDLEEMIGPETRVIDMRTKKQ